MSERVGELIKKYRKLINKSQEEIASDLNVSANYISLIENGKRTPGKIFIKKFAQAYNIPIILFSLPLIIPVGKNKSEKEVEKKLHSIINQLEKLTLNRIKHGIKTTSN